MPVLSPADLILRQYKTDHNLRIRQEIHEKYTVPEIDYKKWVLDTIQWRGDEWLLDVGCGSGLYYETIRTGMPGITYYGLDLSPGILAAHPAPRQNLLVGNARQLPFRDNTFDVIMANHMLYHVQDIHHAIREIRRVLKPDGVLMAATNSLQNLWEFQLLLRRAVVLLTHHIESTVHAPAQSYEAFAIENGTHLLARYFYAVARYDLPASLVFTQDEPAIAYLETTRDLREADLPEDVIWEDVMMLMRQQIRILIKNRGYLRVKKLSGALIATDTGDFIQEFITRQSQQEISGSRPHSPA